MKPRTHRYHETTPRTLIVGDGAIGKVIGAALHANGQDFAFLGRRAESCEQSCCPFRVQTNSGPYEYTAPRAIEASLFETRFTNVIYTVRNDHLNTALAQTQPIWSAADNILFLQGGLQWWLGHIPAIRAHDIGHLVDIDNIGRFSPLLSAKNTAAGLIGFACAATENHNETRLTHKGTLSLGTLDGDAETACRFAALFGQNDFFTADPIDDIYKSSLRKLCNSAALNAASLKWNKPIGWLVENKDAYDYMMNAAFYMGEGLSAFGLMCAPDCPLYLHVLAEKYPQHYMSLLNNREERRYLHDQPFALAQAGHDLRGTGKRYSGI